MGDLMRMLVMGVYLLLGTALAELVSLAVSLASVRNASDAQRQTYTWPAQPNHALQNSNGNCMGGRVKLAPTLS